MVGGKKSVDVSDRVVDAAVEGLKQLNAKSNSVFPFVFATPDNPRDSIVHVEAQVVAGMKYFITVDVTSNGNPSRQYLTVWVQPWLHKTELVAYQAVAIEN